MKSTIMRFYLLLLFLFIFHSTFGQKNDRSHMDAKGIEMVSVRDGKYKVWTKKVGNGKHKLLLLHGGPGTSPEYFFNFPKNLSQDYTIYFYSQLGTHFSDIPKDKSLYTLESFVDDVEEVRKALKLEQFYILDIRGAVILRKHILRNIKNI